ncbi:transposase [Streptomyces albidoflavus]
MTPITCPHCGGLSAYRIRPDGLFGCPECGNLLDRRDIDLDGFEVWGVDETGTLGKLADPVEARKTLHEHLDEYLGEPLDSYWEPSILNAFEWAAADVLDAMAAGLRIPEMESEK